MASTKSNLNIKKRKNYVDEDESGPSTSDEKDLVKLDENNLKKK